MTTLHLWVNNQEGTDCDCTYAYLGAGMNRGWTVPTGVFLDIQASTISGGDAETVFSAFLSLAAAVAEAGHGEDMDGQPIPGQPNLTACPDELREISYTSAAESLARLTCREHTTYAAWAAEVPAMAE